MVEEELEEFNSHDNLRNPQRSAQEKILANNSIASTEYIRDVIRYYKMSLENVDGQPSLSLPEATKRFIEDSTSNWFNKCCEVRKRLNEEWEFRINASVPGIELDKVLNSFWQLEYTEQKPSISSENINKNIGYQDTKKKMITQSLNRLSKEGKNPSRKAKTTYKHEEIIYYEDGWELTDYGRLLFYHIFERKKDPQWIHIASLKIETPYFDSASMSDKQTEILEDGVNYYFDD
jgi:hypothetical protein